MRISGETTERSLVAKAAVGSPAVVGNTTRGSTPFALRQI
jgi:hypothetical protein